MPTPTTDELNAYNQRLDHEVVRLCFAAMKSKDSAKWLAWMEAAGRKVELEEHLAPGRRSNDRTISIDFMARTAMANTDLTGPRMAEAFGKGAEHIKLYIQGEGPPAELPAPAPSPADQSLN